MTSEGPKLMFLPTGVEVLPDGWCVGDTSNHRAIVVAGPALTRRRLRVAGVVQGVGFRPFVYRLATGLSLTGIVGNDSAGVFIEVEGDPAAVDEFEVRLVQERPALARIDTVSTEAVAPTGQAAFEIVASRIGHGVRAFVPPDVATCADCLADVADPGDRRHRYPFTNCTNCGPRFTIIRDVPYDRSATTMAGFTMCSACAAEHADPADRRYHAEPVACPDCGPQIAYELEGAAPVTGTDPVISAVQQGLANGDVVAIKGIGGYHLAVDATNEAAVARLRQRKGRVDKPFAVMAADLDTVLGFAHCCQGEIEALAAPARPIVVLRRRGSADLAPGLAPGNPLIGVMLPYTPLHALLFQPVPGSTIGPPRVIVLTSGNLANEPICYDDDDARARLAGLADAFVTHDRPIEVPCDDSVVRVIDGVALPVRRSRGYAPAPIALPFEVPPVLGVGGELKNTCCVASGRNAWVGQHIGDMENLETLAAFEASVDAFCRMYEVTPAGFGVDAHPGYLTRRWALEHGPTESLDVQHHHAHVAAVMAEHGLDGTTPVLGFAFDGTGYGRAADGAVQIWGGEALLADYDGFTRVAHLAPLPLPGGDQGVRNPCRIAVAYLASLGLPLDPAIPAVAACDPTELAVVARQVERDIGSVPTTSMGRLFDVVASLIGVRHRVSFEAQAAIELEFLAEQGSQGGYELAFELRDEVDHTPGMVVIDPRPVLAGLIEGVLTDASVADLAFAFHIAVADAVARVADRMGGAVPVALTGGVFQNALLNQLTSERLAGHQVLSHRLVPPNDGGLSLGQAIIAGAALRRRKGS